MELQQAEKLAKDLLQKHGLSNWKFQFDNAKRRFGYCTNPEIERIISLSKVLVELNPEEQVRDTILHEIAHALTFQKHGNHGHGRLWRNMALQIGCNGHRCYDRTISKPPRTYTATCPGCGITVERFKRRKIACGKCCSKYNNGKFTEKFLFIFNPKTTCIN